MAKKNTVSAPVAPVVPPTVASQIERRIRRAQRERDSVVSQMRSRWEAIAQDAQNALAVLASLDAMPTDAAGAPIDSDRKATILAERARTLGDWTRSHADALLQSRAELTEALRRLELLNDLREDAEIRASWETANGAGDFAPARIGGAS